MVMKRRQRIPRIENKRDPEPEIAALVRLQNACIAVSAILDGDERDPTWHETQEFEAAGLAYGRILRGESS